MGFEDMSLKDITAEDGIKDLPLKIRGYFAQALKAEAKGDHDKAAKSLNDPYLRKMDG